MSDAFGSAAPLYAAGRHPRLFFGPHDLPVLRARVQTPDGAALFDALRASARPLANRILQDTDLPARLVAAAHRLTPDAEGALLSSAIMAHGTLPLDALAFVALLDESETACRDAAVQLIRAFPEAAARAAAAGVPRFTTQFNRAVAVGYDLTAPFLTEADRRAFTAFAAEQIVHAPVAALLPGFLRTPAGNIPLDTLAFALLTLLAIRGEPGAPALDAECTRLLEAFDAAFPAAFGPNGYPVEDMGYGQAVLAVLVHLAEALHRAGLFDAYSAAPPFARAGRALLQFTEPGGVHFSNTGDCRTSFPDASFVLARLAARTGDGTLAWLLHAFASDRDQPHSGSRFHPHLQLPSGHPFIADTFALLALDSLPAPRHPAAAGLPLAFSDPGRGIVALRDNWGDDAVFVTFDGSQRPPVAQGHAHASAGHFSLSAFGEAFAIHPGRYGMEQREHNVMLVDGQSGEPCGGLWKAVKRAGRLLDFSPHPFVDAATADSTGQHQVFWARRHIGFVKGHGRPAYLWIVDDLNKNDDWATYEWTLNTLPDQPVSLCGPAHAAITGNRHGHVLDIHFLAPPPAWGFPRPHTLDLATDLNTCASTGYLGADMQAAAARNRPPPGGWQPAHPVLVRNRLVATLAGYNGRLLTLLIPRRRDDPPATVTALPGLANLFAVRIAAGPVEDLLLFAFEHKLLKTGPTDVRGQWAVFRSAHGRPLAARVQP